MNTYLIIKGKKVSKRPSKNNKGMIIMDKFKEWLEKLKADLYTIIPSDLWEELYQNLQAEINKDNANLSRSFALIVWKDESNTRIKITTIQHNLVVSIPNMLSNIDQVTFTDFFRALSSSKQKAIKDIIQETIDHSSRNN